MSNETPTTSVLHTDRDTPVGVSTDAFARRALHVKVGNKLDEPLPVALVPVVYPYLSLFDSASAVPAGLNQRIGRYVVPTATAFSLFGVQVSGDNIATYLVYIDGVLVDTRRTYFGGDLNTAFEFALAASTGWQLSAGQVIEVYVTHARPWAGNFSSRIFGTEVNV